MKKFLTYICLFSSLLLVLGIGFEVMLRRIPNSYKFKQEIIEKNSDKVKNLIIGSSVTNCSINPAYLADSTYNISLSGQWDIAGEIHRTTAPSAKRHLGNILSDAVD